MPRLPEASTLDLRARPVRAGELRPGAVVYWMSRDQRAQDNWALLFAQRLACQHRRPLVVVFYKAAAFLNAPQRSYAFMLRGLVETETALRRLGIPLQVLSGALESAWYTLERKLPLGALVTDFDPLRIKQEWRARVTGVLRGPLYEVDAHNVVPCWLASPKAEYGAYTFRPKLRRQLAQFLVPFPKLVKHPLPFSKPFPPVDWDSLQAKSAPDPAVAPLRECVPGSRAGLKRLHAFVQSGLEAYATRRNDPNQDGASGLSPYLHFGHVSAQRVALTVSAAPGALGSQEAFLEELIVRRELSDNFCFYHPEYDRVSVFPTWAQATLRAHAEDPRPYLYSRTQLEQAATHDELWNAAQRQMLLSGSMHGYLRMYWAKKILEWSPSAQAALERAIYLNDRYSLDGRDPNGYAGIAWSIGGVHDRAWGERPVFGKIRCMTPKGCAGKFDVKAYISRWRPQEV